MVLRNSGDLTDKCFLSSVSSLDSLSPLWLWLPFALPPVVFLFTHARGLHAYTDISRHDYCPASFLCWESICSLACILSYSLLLLLPLPRAWCLSTPSHVFPLSSFFILYFFLLCSTLSISDLFFSCPFTPSSYDQTPTSIHNPTIASLLLPSFPLLPISFPLSLPLSFIVELSARGWWILSAYLFPKLLKTLPGTHFHLQRYIRSSHVFPCLPSLPILPPSLPP